MFNDEEVVIGFLHRGSSSFLAGTDDLRSALLIGNRAAERFVLMYNSLSSSVNLAVFSRIAIQ